MQLFINIFLIAFFYWNVKGENKLCSNDNVRKKMIKSKSDAMNVK